MSQSDTKTGLLDFPATAKIGERNCLESDPTLFQQDERVKSLFVVRSGSVKLLYVSPEGKAQTLEILGANRGLGPNECLLGAHYEATAEVVEFAVAHALPLEDFQHLLIAAAAVPRCGAARTATNLRQGARWSWS